MRTVHETEALRPSDPVPKSMQSGGAAGKTTKLKIIIRTPQSHAAGQDDAVDDGNSGDESSVDLFTQLSDKDGFSDRELNLPLEQLHFVCKKQVKWAEEDGERLKQECKKWEDIYKQAWLEKEVLLSQMVKTEVDWHERRRAVLSGTTDVVILNGGPPEPPKPRSVLSMDEQYPNIHPRPGSGTSVARDADLKAHQHMDEQ